MRPFDDIQTWDDLCARMPHVYGYNTIAERQMLMDIAKALPAQARVLEIGVLGGDALSIMSAMAPESVEFVGIDSWENQTIVHMGVQLDTRQVCLSQMAANGVSERIIVLDGSSHDLASAWRLPLTVLRVDGDHTYGGALADLNDFAAWVVPDGLCLIDDYGAADGVAWADVRRATDAWLHEQGTRWRIVSSFLTYEEGKTLVCQRAHL